MPRINPDDYLDHDAFDDEDLNIEHDDPKNRLGQIIKPKNPYRQDPTWEDTRKQLQRKFRRDYD